MLLLKYQSSLALVLLLCGFVDIVDFAQLVWMTGCGYVTMLNILEYFQIKIKISAQVIIYGLSSANS